MNIFNSITIIAQGTFLCPPLPNRANYICWLNELIGGSEQDLYINFLLLHLMTTMMMHRMQITIIQKQTEMMDMSGNVKELILARV
jgi:hypothetical protein